MKKLDVLCFCAVLSASMTVLSASMFAQPGDVNTSSQSGSNDYLIKLAQKVRPDFYIGSYAMGLDSLDKLDENYVQLAKFFTDNFNIITVGTYMFDNQQEQGEIIFERSDYLVDFAIANGLKVYFHPGIGGGEYHPEWLNKGNFTKEELSKIMREQITGLLTRYKGKVHYFDVVNEPLDGTGMTADGQFNWIKRTRGGEHFWLKEMGMYQGKKYQFPQYLVDAYRIAREVGGKEVKLILNQWGTETTKSSKGLAFLELIKALQEEGIPVDGAGLQLHCKIRDGKITGWGNVPIDLDAFDEMLRLYEQAGIDVHITEFDIHLPQNPTQEDFQLQGVYYAELLKHAIKSPAVKTFKTWGFTDRYAWKPDGYNTYPYLLDERFKPKPAYIKQIEMLKSLTSE